MGPRIVLDTNVLVAAIRSRNGASFQILQLVRHDRVRLVLSVPLVLEYEDALKRSGRAAGLSNRDIDDLIDYLCSVGEHREIFFLWRPSLKDPNDDMVLEVAVEAGCDHIVTHNVKDFAGAERYRVSIVTPGDLLRTMGELP
jgi:putative PIN family toxin of toxin-antitoxin system